MSEISIYEKGIIAAVKEVYAETINQGERTFIRFIISDINGDIAHNITVPANGHHVVGELQDGKPITGIAINISAQACSEFMYDEEHNDFIYSCRVGGQPFTGNIPVTSIVSIFNPDTQEVFYQNAMPQINQPKPVEDKKEEDKNKPKGGLKIVK